MPIGFFRIQNCFLRFSLSISPFTLHLWIATSISWLPIFHLLAFVEFKLSQTENSTCQLYNPETYIYAIFYNRSDFEMNSRDCLFNKSISFILFAQSARQWNARNEQTIKIKCVHIGIRNIMQSLSIFACWSWFDETALVIDVYNVDSAITFKMREFQQTHTLTGVRARGIYSIDGAIGAQKCAAYQFKKKKEQTSIASLPRMLATK